jgi:hypothetical protein
MPIASPREAQQAEKKRKGAAQSRLGIADVYRLRFIRFGLYQYARDNKIKHPKTSMKTPTKRPPLPRATDSTGSQRANTGRPLLPWSFRRASGGALARPGRKTRAATPFIRLAGKGGAA